MNLLLCYDSFHHTSQWNIYSYSDVVVVVIVVVVGGGGGRWWWCLLLLFQPQLQ